MVVGNLRLRPVQRAWYRLVHIVLELSGKLRELQYVAMMSKTKLLESVWGDIVPRDSILPLQRVQQVVKVRVTIVATRRN